MKNFIMVANLVIALIAVIMLHFDLVQDAFWKFVTALALFVTVSANVVIIWRDVIRLDREKK